MTPKHYAHRILNDVRLRHMNMGTGRYHIWAKWSSVCGSLRTWLAIMKFFFALALARAHNSPHSFIQSHLIAHSLCMARIYALHFSVWWRVSVTHCPPSHPSIYWWSSIDGNIKNKQPCGGRCRCVLHVEAAASNERIFFCASSRFSISHRIEFSFFSLSLSHFLAWILCATSSTNERIDTNEIWLRFHVFLLRLLLRLPVKSNYPSLRDQKCNCVVFRWRKVNSICLGEQSQSRSGVVFMQGICVRIVDVSGWVWMFLTMIESKIRIEYAWTIRLPSSSQYWL